MPAPKDPIKNAEWRAKLSLRAIESGLGKAPKRTVKDLTAEERRAISARALALCTPEEREVRRKRAIDQGFGKSNKGRILTVAHKEAMTEALKGKTYDEIYGSDAGNQRKARKLTNIATYSTRSSPHKRDKHNGDYRYVDWRKVVFSRDDFTCQHCKTRGGILHAHHIKPWAKHEDLRYEIDNGVTLCQDCHRKVHTKDELNATR